MERKQNISILGCELSKYLSKSRFTVWISMDSNGSFSVPGVTVARLGRGQPGGGRLLALVGRPAHNLSKGPFRDGAVQGRLQARGGSKLGEAPSKGRLQARGGSKLGEAPS